MKISVIGLGYIGLPTAAILASKNLSVFGVDKNINVVKKIRDGSISFAEPNLNDLVKDVIDNGYLKVQSEPIEADIYIIAVPTPLGRNNKPDISYIKAASLSIAPFLKKGDLIILESTSPVGTTEKVIKWISRAQSKLTFPTYNQENVDFDISFAYCPERVLPGNILDELITNNRIIGGVTKKCSEMAHRVYKSFVKSECYLTDSRTAELCKLVENSFRDVNIGFANELSLICDKLDIDVWGLIKLANYHPRVNILNPGPGVGGHCIAVDPWFIVDKAKDESKIIQTARLVNDSKPDFVINKINSCVENLNKKKSDIKIASLGLAFKANIDDLRESPALEIASKIQNMKFLKHFIVEPNIRKKPDIEPLSDSELVSINDAIKESDILVLLVDHDDFKRIDPNLLSNKEIVDTRGIWTS